MARQPNILILLSDQHRWSALNCYGNSDVISPTFDRLAAEGVRYTRCVSSAPMCCPFRATFQTGLHTHQHGVRANKSPWLSQHFRSLADCFNAAGYETCFIGKSHWGRTPHDGPQGEGYVPPDQRMRWTHWHAMAGHAQYDSKTYDDAGRIQRDFEDQHQPTVQTDLLIENLQAFGDRPWLVQLNRGPPHTVSGKVQKKGVPLIETCHRVNREYGFGLDDAVIDDYPRTKLYLLLPQHLVYDAPIMPASCLDQYAAEALHVDPNVPAEFRKMVSYHLREYYGMITSLDAELAQIMAFLEESGRSRDTLVIYTSDHGDKIGAYCDITKFRTKSTWHQNACRVPLIVWGPGVGVGRGVVNDTPIGSVDFLPALLQFAGLPNEPHLPGESFADTFTGRCAARDREVLLSLDPWRGVYDGQYFYAAERCDGAWRPTSLVDTVADPYDLHNLLDDPTHVATRNRLHSAMERELQRTADHHE